MNDRERGQDAGAGVDRLLKSLLSRRELLACLAGGPHTKPELVAECGVSRSTIDRSLDALAETGVVAGGSQSRYELTLFGEVVVREFERMLYRLERLSAVRELITEIGIETGADAGLFEDATFRPVEGIGVNGTLELFVDATEVRVVDPSFPLVYMALLSGTDPFDGAETTLLVHGDVVAELSALGWESIADALPPAVEIRKLDRPLPFSFALVGTAEGRALHLLLRDRFEGTTIVEMSTPTAIEWGEALYERVARDAAPVTPDDD